MGIQTKNERSNVGDKELSITEYFSKQLLEENIDGQSTAVICESTNCQISFGELELKSTKLAQVISQFLLKNKNGMDENLDTVIGVRMNPTIDLVVCLMAILKCGVAYVPIGSGDRVPLSRIKHIIQDCRPCAIISDSDLDIGIDFTSLGCPTWGIKELLTLANQYGRNRIQNYSISSATQDIALILYTSGSTGMPKGVRVSHRSIMNRLLWQWDEFPFEPEEKCCIKTSITFGDSIAEIFGPLLQGVPVVIYSTTVVSQPDILIQSLSKHGITRIVLVPSLLQSILKTLELFQIQENRNGNRNNTTLSCLDSLRLWVCSGEALTADLLRSFFLRFPRNSIICNFYGSTEVTFDVTYEIFQNSIQVEEKIDSNGNVPIGRNLRNAETYILSDSLEQVRIGEVGELFVGGKVLANGYVGCPTSDKFIRVKLDGKSTLLFRTGDLVKMSPCINGKLNLFYVGRKDSQIKVRGHRVDLSEIQTAMKRIKQLENSVVLCYEPGTEDQKILAFIISKEKTANIKKWLKMELENYQMPTLIPISEIPLLVNGKMDRQSLLNLYRNKLQNGISLDKTDLKVSKSTNGSPAEITTIQCFADILRIPVHEIISNLNESFYSIGGTSLNTILVILKLQENGIQISIPEFVRMKSIAEVLTHINLNVNINVGENPCDYVSKPKLAKPSRMPSSELRHGVLGSQSEYIIEPLSHAFKDHLLELISYGEANKGDLELLVKPTEQDVADWLIATYDFYVNVGLSFVVKRASDRTIVATAINRGLTDVAPEFNPAKNHAYVFEILGYIDGLQKSSLPSALDKIFRSGPINTRRDIGHGENVVLMTLVEEQNVLLAKQHGFKGILSTNLSPLSQQVTRDVLGYKVLLDLQVNQFQSEDGSRPFSAAPDDQRAICCYKSLNHD